MAEQITVEVAYAFTLDANAVHVKRGSYATVDR